jgi:hypothetical protein
MAMSPSPLVGGMHMLLMQVRPAPQAPLMQQGEPGVWPQGTHMVPPQLSAPLHTPP